MEHQNPSVPRRCAACGGRGHVIETRNHAGLTRRRLECQKGHRWTTVELRPPTGNGRARLRPVIGTAKRGAAC